MTVVVAVGIIDADVIVVDPPLVSSNLLSTYTLCPHRLPYQLTIVFSTQVQNALPVAAAVRAGARAEAAIAVSLIRPLASPRLCFTTCKGH